jgi:uroporphyrinogen-III synthase
MLRHAEALRGRHILLTRARGENDKLRALLESGGGQVFELPAIAIEPPPDWAEVDAAIRAVDVYDWIVFTSRNAVNGFTDRARLLGVPIAPSPRRLIGAVGPSTALALRERGIQIVCLTEGSTARELGAALASSKIEGKRVLLPRGNLARTDLQEELEAAGAQVDAVIVYRTVAPGASDSHALTALVSHQIDTIVLASPSALHNLVSMLGGDPAMLETVALACIGPTTASAVSSVGLHPAIVAPHPTAISVAEAMVEYYEASHISRS